LAIYSDRRLDADGFAKDLDQFGSVRFKPWIEVTMRLKVKLGRAWQQAIPVIDRCAARQLAMQVLVTGMIVELEEWV
jgi:hypothetical protein